jgi:uncharacterized protein
MALSEDLLNILVCPVCREPMDLVWEGKGLKCRVCKRVYPIQDDVPIMLRDAAKVEE